MSDLPELPPAMEKLLTHNLIGKFEIECMDGQTRVIDVQRTIYDSRGEPMFMMTDSGKVYPWRNVISIEEVK